MTFFDTYDAEHAEHSEREHIPPYWTYALFDGECALCRASFVSGESVWYYPDTGAMYCAKCAQTADAETGRNGHARRDPNQLRLF